jgi:PPK2 family polyphosphate:nucleotide phosphotransferase
VLLVLQGLDTSGKGGTVRHVVGPSDPAGVHAASFGRPTAEELRHDFLWRIRQQLPRAGKLGVFDRSHYEDVLAVRVRKLADKRTWTRRYDAINRFEAELAESGTRVVKCYLHISREEQRARLLARLETPTKHWKYNPHDLEDRALWDDYMAAYADALERCSTEAGAVAHHPRRSQVVPQLGDHPAAVRGARRARAGVAGGRLRRQRRAAAGPLGR